MPKKARSARTIRNFWILFFVLLGLITPRYLLGSVVYTDDYIVTLADEWEQGDEIQIGTIVLQNKNTYVVCFETLLSYGVLGDLKIMGPANCSEPTDMNAVDEALKAIYEH